MATDDNSLPQLDMSKSVPVQPTADASAPPTLDMSKSIPISPSNKTPMKTPGPQDFGQIAGDIATGALKGTLATPDAIAHGIHKITGEAIVPEQGIKAMDQIATPQGGAQRIGAGIEQVGEFAAGDEALMGLAKLSKVPEAVLALAEKYPKTAKFILGTAKTSAEGGAQGAVHGAPEGKSAEEAKGGAIAGAVAEPVTQIASEIASIAGKRVGIGTSADQDAVRGFRPGKNNSKFLDDFQIAAPHMQADPEFRAAGNDVRQQTEALSDVRRNWWKNDVEPIIESPIPNDPHGRTVGDVPLSGISIRDSIEAKIPDSMKKFHPEKAAQVQQFANQFMPGQKFALNIRDAENDLEYFNAQLADTGYWRKSPSERAAMLKTNPEAMMAANAADAIRDEMYNRIGIVKPGVDMERLKRTYGALRNVENELQGRVNVEGRQAPTSLKELVGLTAGIATGGLHGAMAAVIPAVDREANTAGRLVKRAVQKEATGKEGPLATAVKKVGGAVEAVAPPAATVAGENIGRVYFHSSDGKAHSVSADQLDAARAIDPGLKIIEGQ